MVKTVTICQNIFSQIFEESVSIKISPRQHFALYGICDYYMVKLTISLCKCNYIPVELQHTCVLWGWAWATLNVLYSYVFMHWFCHILQVTLHYSTKARGRRITWTEHVSECNEINVVQSVLEWLVSLNFFYRNITLYKRFVVAILP